MNFGATLGTIIFTCIQPEACRLFQEEGQYVQKLFGNLDVFMYSCEGWFLARFYTFCRIVHWKYTESQTSGSELKWGETPLDTYFYLNFSLISIKFLLFHKM